MSKKSVIVLSLLGLVLTSCSPQTVSGKVTNLSVRTTIEVQQEVETKRYGVTSVPLGAEVKKEYTKTRVITVCGTSKAKSSSSSRSTTSKPKSSGINLKKDTPTPKKSTATSNNKPSGINLKKSPTVVKTTTPSKPCTTKTESYTAYDVEVEHWMHYQTFTSNSFEAPSVPSHLYNEDDYQVGNPITNCTVSIPSENLYNVNVDCNVWETLKEGQSIKGTVMGNQLTLL